MRLAVTQVNPIRLLRRYVKAHHVSRAALVGLGIVTAFLFFIIGAGIRLLIGPVSLGPFAGSLADAIDRALPGISVKYDQAAIEWERDEGRVNLVILGTRVFDRDGRIIAQAPKADIALAARPLLNGKVEVKRIVLVGVQLTLVHTKEGRLRLGIGKDSGEDDILKRISDALKKNKGPSTLQSFAVRRARLAFFDEPTKLFVVAPRADFRLSRVGDHLTATADADVEVSGRPAHIKATVQLPDKTGPITGKLAVTGFAVHSLAMNSATFAAVKNTALNLDLTGSFKLENERLVSADFALSAKGALTIPDLKNGVVKVSELRATGRYDGVKRHLLLEDGAIAADKVKARLKGKLDFDVAPSGDLSGLRGDLKIAQLAFAWPGVFAKPVQFQSVDFVGAWKRDTRDLVIDRVAVAGPPFALQASGRIAFVPNQSVGVDITGTIAPLNVHDLVHYWPLGAAGGGREWVEANMPAGQVGPTQFAIHVAPGMFDQPALPPDAISVKFPVSGAEVIYIKGLTHMTGVTGTAVVTGNSFEANVVSAKVGPLTVSGAKFVIPDFSTAEETGIVTGHIQGAMPDVLALVDMGNLRYPTRFGINAASAKGDANLDLKIDIPMQKSVSVDKIAIGIKAVVNGFGLSLGPHMQLTDGAVEFAIDNAHLRATGTSGIGGSASRLNLDWTEEFKTAKAITTKVSLKGAVDDTARNALNLGLQDYFKGSIGITGTLIGHRGSLTQANFALDLTPTVITVDLIGLNKPAGFPMSARVTTAFAAGSAMDTQTIRISGPGTSVIANMKFEGGQHLAQLQAPTVRIGQNDFALTVTRGSGNTDIQIRGRALDGSRIGRRGSSNGTPGGAGASEKFDEAFHINARLDRLALRENVVLTNFLLDITGIADRPATMSLSASVSKSATLTGSIVPIDNGRRLTMSTGDMGTLLQGLYGFASMKGGKLDVSATFVGRADVPAQNGPDVPDLQGKASLKDFRVLNQPFLARLFSAGSLMGLANLMQGQGIEVSSLDVPFTSRNNVISVHDVRATGPAIGISADGYIDRPKNAIALKGSLVPLFGLNSVLGNIPLLGTVITSKQGEGIIGMTYSVSGNTDQPDVSVNPLSALAPGILRRIFEGSMPNAANAPSNAPPPNATPPKPQPKPRN